jgi:putative protease
MAIHLSTQANTTNYNSVLFWQDLGVRRINAARELSLEEIAQIASHSTIEIEAFVHGAMCISYSGRCLLSNFMANRESNRGYCAHACRWKYALAEETGPGQYMPINGLTISFEESQKNKYSLKYLIVINSLAEKILTVFRFQSNIL